MRDQPNPWAPAGVKVRRSRIRHLELAARSRVWRPPHLSVLPAFGFREESHAIEAAIAGQGLAICSDVLVAPEQAVVHVASYYPSRLAIFLRVAICRKNSFIG
jgi:hypothetical protein